MSNFIILKPKKDDVDRTLFKYLVKIFDNVPISRIEKSFRQKDIKVNGVRNNNKQYKVQLKDEIIVYGLENVSKPFERQDANINFKLIYEDKNLLIVDKAINVAMHSEPNCLDNQILKYLNYKKTSSFTPASIGRIDKKTSGLVVYAKNYKTLVEFDAKQNNFEKIYQFVSDFNEETIVKNSKSINGRINPKLEITVRLKKEVDKEKMVVDPNFGVKAKTIFWIENNKKYAQILTGKKHQIRATLEYLKTPILGDIKYGGERAKRLFLHSYSVKFSGLSEEFAEYNNQIFIAPTKW
ncbi:ribosomal large subunit pseudouridine synthase C [Metamycoplasma cloacale]|uniref:RNA pseudouridylate synthase n=1 Tax=Metamycoplasma cloacale TaxID=92401 RepID=A0A2Z4LLN5_9BACT|nr:RluA family pseudouridine synthase [Metamycoplasma cloacale]AWX42643.1 RluA family pseudouridine synthase [Metamycoplasma cloacale]VEU79574.1 ribosomal large subunit pseudouridine synthase C [Metamycoplasma cloacale]